MATDCRFIGIHPHRLNTMEDEAVFADAWHEINVKFKRAEDKTLLAELLHTGEYVKEQIKEPSDRDYEVAATVMQWLGSPVGISWLFETMKKTTLGRSENHA